MARTLIVYASHHGQTAKIVERMAARLRGHGHEVTVWRADRVAPGASIAGFDAYLVAGSVELGRHQRSVRDFVRSHLAELEAAPSAFVSVCGALIGGWSEGPSEARKYVDRFLAETGWHPRTARSLAGAVAYTKYGWFTRWMMKQISRKTGRPTDTSRDWEGTDWPAVDRLADELADAASPSARTAVAAG
jgi:menaquinone-dependent protoporphyrinogen oxidase